MNLHTVKKKKSRYIGWQIKTETQLVEMNEIYISVLVCVYTYVCIHGYIHIYMGRQIYVHIYS